VLDLAGTTVDDVAHLDLYSCFPSAVELALQELDIPIDRQLTVYGGLSFAGGPWNNPVGHAIASMVDVLRGDPGSLGLVTANGGIVDKHAFGVFSTEPPSAGFRYERPQAEIDARGGRLVDGDHVGAATIETWTVVHQRDGSMERAIIAALTDEGARTWALSEDDEVMGLLERSDVTGARITIDAEHRALLD
jgi:acetyl-CoA C-acetyltransferase